MTPIADIELFLKEFDKRVKLNWNKIKIIDPCAGGNKEIRDDIGIKEVYHPISRIVEVEAKNEEEAEEKVREIYMNEDIVLDASDFQGVEYFVQ